MVGPDGKDSPSSIGPLIIWQQPHPIYYAELCYRGVAEGRDVAEVAGGGGGNGGVFGVVCGAGGGKVCAGAGAADGFGKQ